MGPITPTGARGSALLGRAGRIPLWAWIAGLVAVEAAFLLLGLGFADDPVLGGDGPTYERYARNIAEHGVFSPAAGSPFFPSVSRSPGYPAFLAIFHVFDSEPLIFVRLAQFVLVCGTALLTARLVAPLAGDRAGAVAALLCATYIPLLLLANYHLTEVLATFLVVALVSTATRAAQPSAGYRACCATGVLGGALALVRPSMALFAPALAAAIALSKRRSAGVGGSAAAALTVLVSLALVLAPFAVRNYSVAERFVPLGSVGSSSLFVSMQQYLGNTTYELRPEDIAKIRADGERRAKLLERQIAERRDASDVPARTQSELEVADSYSESARTAMGKLDPLDVLADIPRRIQGVWGTADFFPAHVGTFPHRLAQGQHGLLILLAVLGAAMSRQRWRELWPLWVCPAYLTLLHLVYQIEARYTIPARPFLLAFSALGLLTLLGLRPSRPPE